MLHQVIKITDIKNENNVKKYMMQTDTLMYEIKTPYFIIYYIILLQNNGILELIT